MNFHVYAPSELNENTLWLIYQIFCDRSVQVFKRNDRFQQDCRKPGTHVS